jgi:hypothetical protein
MFILDLGSNPRHFFTYDPGIYTYTKSCAKLILKTGTKFGVRGKVIQDRYPELIKKKKPRLRNNVFKKDL